MVHQDFDSFNQKQYVCFFKDLHFYLTFFIHSHKLSDGVSQSSFFSQSVTLFYDDARMQYLGKRYPRVSDLEVVLRTSGGLGVPEARLKRGADDVIITNQP